MEEDRRGSTRTMIQEARRRGKKKKKEEEVEMEEGA